MTLGGQLRRLRETRGIAADRAAEAIRASHSKISRLELGRTGFKQRDVTDLLNLYEVTDEDERAGFLTLAKLASAPGRLHTYGDLLPSWAQARLELEEAATVIRSYSLRYVPWLLQTEAYARALIQLDFPGLSSLQQDRLVKLVTEHRRILQRMDPPKLWAVIDEAALRRQLGGQATLRRQLQHVAEIAQLPNVTIQMVPFSVGMAPDNAFTILRFTDPDLSEAVYNDHNTRPHQLDKPTEVIGFRMLMDELCAWALPPSATTSIIEGILAEN